MAPLGGSGAGPSRGWLCGRAGEKGERCVSCNDEGKQQSEFFPAFWQGVAFAQGWIFRGDEAAVRRERDEAESVALGRTKARSAQLRQSPGREVIYNPDGPFFSFYTC